MKDGAVICPSFCFETHWMPSKNYFDFVTIAKGFAIACVVLGHFTPSYMPLVYQHLKESVYLFHMPLFMLLAGFLFYNSVEKGPLAILPFIRKKFLRLMVPYFFLSFCIAALNGCLQRFIPVKKPVDAMYLYRIFYENVGGSATFLWFLYTLFIIFVLAAVVMRLPKGRYIFLILACILYFVPLPSVFYLNSVGAFSLYFVAGIFLYTFISRRTFLSWRLAIVSALLFLLAYSGRLFITDTSFKVLMTLLCGLSACLFILCVSDYLAHKPFRSVRLLKTMGRYSSYIYLLHMAGVYSVRLVYEKLGWQSHLSYALFLILAIVVGCLFPVLIGKYIIKPCSALLFLMGEGKKSGKNLDRMKK